VALAAGAAVGAFYFGGLWLTVRRVVTSDHPVLLTFGSFAVRAVVAVAVMVWIARTHWQLLLAAMAGFVLVRVVMTRKLRPEGEPVAVKDRSAT
jgi:F1F0 ATPase subunit 2